MNNYCTNCGKRLEKDELVCKDCNTPIVKLPSNYHYQSPQKRKIIKTILIVAVIYVLCIFSYYSLNDIANKMKIHKLQKEKVEPYIKKTYPDKDYSIKYHSQGKCIIDGDCLFDPSMGCDGGTCYPYKYLESEDCKSYYYSVELENETITITVVHQRKKYYVVEGKNIYGKDKLEEKESDSDLEDTETSNPEE